MLTSPLGVRGVSCFEGLLTCILIGGLSGSANPGGKGGKGGCGGMVSVPRGTGSKSVTDSDGWSESDMVRKQCTQNSRSAAAVSRLHLGHRRMLADSVAWYCWLAHRALGLCGSEGLWLAVLTGNSVVTWLEEGLRGPFLGRITTPHVSGELHGG